MAVATYGCGGWHLTGEMLSKLRTWELQHLRKIFPSKHQPTRAEYMIKSIEHVDEIRSKKKLHTLSISFLTDTSKILLDRHIIGMNKA